MSRFFVLNLSLIITCCYRTDIVQYGSANTDPATFASGQQLPTKPKDLTYFCNPAGLGRKGCKFLSKYDGTIWADTENYYSDFSDIQFLNIAYFISFFDINNDVSYCKDGDQVKILMME